MGPSMVDYSMPVALTMDTPPMNDWDDVGAQPLVVVRKTHHQA
jgi:hypothetical protein